MLNLILILLKVKETKKIIKVKPINHIHKCHVLCVSSDCIVVSQIRFPSL